MAAIFTAKTSTTAALANRGLVILPAGKALCDESYWGAERGIVFRPGVVAGYLSIEKSTLEHPMSPLRHGGIGPISTMG